jgi:hypothetical protein
MLCGVLCVIRCLSAVIIYIYIYIYIYIMLPIYTDLSLVQVTLILCVSYLNIL